MTLDSETGGRSVVGRAFDVLDCFAGGVELGVADVCASTGLAPATVHRFLSALVSREVVERVAHGRYRLGPRIWRLGITVPEMRELRDLAQPHLVKLHLATRGTVYLAMRDGGDAVVSDRITLVRPSAESSRASRRMPLDRSGGGRAILAYSPDAWDELVTAAAQDDALAGRLPALEARLEEIRRTGTGVSLNDAVHGRTSVAAPIFGIDGQVHASVAVAFPGVRIAEPNSVVPHVSATARAIGLELSRWRRS